MSVSTIVPSLPKGKLIALLLLCCGLVPATPSYGQSIIHVDDDAIGADDGTSWTNAYTSLNDAINNATGSDVIVIAGGIYKPGSSRTGVYCDGVNTGNECSPTLANVVFVGNTANENGGALYNNGIFLDGTDFTGGKSNPVLTNVLFVNNSTRRDGGAIAKLWPQWREQPSHHKHNLCWKQCRA